MELWKAVFISVDRLVKFIFIFLLAFLISNIIFYGCLGYFGVSESIETPWLVLAGIGCFVFAIHITCEIMMIKLSKKMKKILYGILSICTFIVYIWHFSL